MYPLVWGYVTNDRLLELRPLHTRASGVGRPRLAVLQLAVGPLFHRLGGLRGKTPSRPAVGGGWNMAVLDWIIWGPEFVTEGSIVFKRRKRF